MKKEAEGLENNKPNHKDEPAAHAEDVVYSEKTADEEDREAQERAEQADKRAE